MAEFLIAYKKTAGVEGGYANDPADRGGETFKGIARNLHPDWQGWPMIDAIKARVGHTAEWIDRAAAANSSLNALVLKFYKETQWDVLSLDGLNDQKVANELYDTGVNMGTGRAGLFFQRVLNVVNKGNALYPDLKLDGQIGTKSLQAFNSLNLSDKAMVWRLLNCLQGEKYISICEANPSQERFMRSWASRVFE